MPSTNANILVVDDEKEIAELLSITLGSKGYRVVSVTDTEVAIEQIKTGNFDIILLDLMMPKHSGMELLKLAKQVNPTTEVVMITGCATVETAAEAMEKGAYNYLCKPFEIEKVFTVVQKALEKQELESLLALYKTSKSIFSTINMDELLNTIVHQVGQVSRADESLIMLFDEKDHLYVAAGSGLDSEDVRKTRLTLCESLAGRIMSEKNPVILIGEIDHYRRLLTEYQCEEVKSCILHPILARNKIFGILNLNRTHIEENFNEGDLKKVSIFVSMMAQAIENAALYRNLKEKVRQLDEAHQELKAQQEKTIRTEKLSALGKMIAGMAHEINNPLTIILGFSEYLMKSAPDEQNQTNLKKIVDSAQRCRKIISNLVSFSRPRDAEKKSMKANSILEEVIELMSYDLKTNHIELKRELQEKLPSISVDPQQIKQVFANIFDNAIFAIRKKQIPDASIVVRTRVEEQHILIQVIDNGIGIKKENLGKIFDPFYTTCEIGAGTGLGLSTAYGVMKDHKGNIYATSVEGKGTTISIELPFQTKDQEQQEQAVVDKGKSEKKKRILVVDDEVFITDLCQTVLEEFGHHTEIAQNGRSAIAKIDQNDYDLIILDMKMPDLSGIDIYDYVQRKKPELVKHIVFSTGDTVSEDTHDFFVKTGSDYISKPFKANQLLEFVNRGIG